MDISPGSELSHFPALHAMDDRTAEKAQTALKIASHSSHHPSMFTTTTSFLLVPILTVGCAASTPFNGVKFLFPTQGVTLHYNDYVEVQYTSGFSKPWLFAFCNASDGTISEKPSRAVGGLNNTATVRIDWPGADTPCWFNLKPNLSAPLGTDTSSDDWSFDVEQRAATTVRLREQQLTASTAPGTTPALATATATAG